LDENLIATQGETFEELKKMILEAVNLTFEDQSFIYTEDEIQKDLLILRSTLFKVFF